MKSYSEKKSLSTFQSCPKYYPSSPSMLVSALLARQGHHYKFTRPHAIMYAQCAICTRICLINQCQTNHSANCYKTVKISKVAH